MLQVAIPGKEYYDEDTGCFINTKEQVLQLEHSLVSLAKWESKWCKPFIGKGEKSIEESIDYVRCMTLTQNVDPICYSNITSEVLDQINAYIEAPMTATWFSKAQSRGGSNEAITAEILYYRMIALDIPFECQKWHLNRLLTLMQVCSIKNGPQKKMSRRDTLSQNRALNESRKNNLKTNG